MPASPAFQVMPRPSVVSKVKFSMGSIRVAPVRVKIGAALKDKRFESSVKCYQYFLLSRPTKMTPMRS